MKRLTISRERISAAVWRVLESNAFLAFGFAEMATIAALLVGHYLKLDYYAGTTPPLPIEYFGVTALVIGAIAALLGWLLGRAFPKRD